MEIREGKKICAIQGKFSHPFLFFSGALSGEKLWKSEENGKFDVEN